MSREGSPAELRRAPSPPPAEKIGSVPHWYSHPYNRPELYRLAEVMAWLPRTMRLGLARQLGRLAARLMPQEREAVRTTMTAVTGAVGARLDELTGRVFRDFAMCFSDLVSTNREGPARYLRRIARVTGAGPLRDLDGGVISLTAHMGNWELAGRLLAGHSAKETHVVVTVDEAAKLTRWVRRNGDGVRFVPRARQTSSLGLLAALRRGEAVAVQADRALGNRGDVMVSFFGRPAPFPIGPFVLARASGVPLVPAFCLLDADYGYEVEVAPLMRVARSEEEAALRTWVGLLESMVRRRPTQWFNFFDIWNPFGA